MAQNKKNVARSHAMMDVVEIESVYFIYFPLEQQQLHSIEDYGCIMSICTWITKPYSQIPRRKWNIFISQHSGWTIEMLFTVKKSFKNYSNRFHSSVMKISRSWFLFHFRYYLRFSSSHCIAFIVCEGAKKIYFEWNNHRQQQRSTSEWLFILNRTLVDTCKWKAF